MITRDEQEKISDSIKKLSHTSVAVKRAAFVTLFTLFGEGSSEIAIKQRFDEIPHLLVRLLNDADEKIRVYAVSMMALCLASTDRQEETTINIVRAGAIPSLMHCLLDGPTAKHAVMCLHLLITASIPGHESQVATAMASAGSIPSLVALLHDRETAVYASSLLRGILVIPVNQTEVVRAGAVPILVRLLSDADLRTRVFSCGALGNLVMNNPGNQMTVASAGAIPCLVRLLNDTDASMRVSATFTLHALAWNNGNIQRIIVNMEGLPALERLLARTDNPIDIGNPAWQMIQIFRVIVAQCINEQPRQRVQQAITVNAGLPSPVETVFSRMTVSPSASKTIPFDQLEIQRELGRGGFGVVHRAMWQRVTPVAVKLLRERLTPTLLDEFKREAHVHMGLRHPNIIALYGICVETTRYALVVELMENGSLYDVLQRPASALPWLMRLTIALDLASGLLYLHEQNIIHRDLKSLNVLIDESLRAKISDFGLAKIKHTTASMTKGEMGTTQWMAPELFEEDGCCDKTTDVYATGIVFWEIAARKLPYEGKNTAQIIRHVDRGGRESIPEAPPKFAALITRCWEQRAEDRPSIEEVAEEMQSIQSTYRR